MISYPLISVSCNILPFLLQGSGSILVATAIRHRSDPKTGIRLVIAGLAFQIFTLILFGMLCLEFGLRAHINRHKVDPFTKVVHSLKRFRFFWVSLAHAYVLIIIRCIYRVAGLSGSWSGKLVRNETIFIVLEGV